MTDDERLKLFHKLFPLLKLTIGQLLQAKVYQDQAGLLYLIDIMGDCTVVDFERKTTYHDAILPYNTSNDIALTTEQADKFWERLHTMLIEQALVVNGINQNTEPINLKPFDEADWWVWASAEKPPDSEPLINYNIKIAGFGEDFNIAMIIMDAKGIEINLYNQSDLLDVERCYELEAEWPTGWHTLVQMSEPLTPQMLSQLKFKQVS